MIGSRALRLVVSGDHNLMRRLNRWRPPRWFRRWMITATRAGDGWLWLAVAVVVLLAGGPQRFDAITVAGAAAMSGIAVFWALKRTARRTRPCAIERSCWAELLPPDQFSFPSGHSITAFACAVPLAFFYPVFAAWFFFCALSIAASRVILGLHFLSDVLAGCLLGAILGYSSFVLLG
jgi:undecaprenyl-diphosphatase